jgi:hypothetical protein
MVTQESQLPASLLSKGDVFMPDVFPLTFAD